MGVRVPNDCGKQKDCKSPVCDILRCKNYESSMRKNEKDCVPGCIHFENGDIKHHKHCPTYVESLSRMVDMCREKLDDCLRTLAYMSVGCPLDMSATTCGKDDCIQCKIDYAKQNPTPEEKQ